MANNDINPLKTLRKSSGLTIEQVCYQTGLSKSLVIKQEQGTYNEISRTLLAFYKDVCPTDFSVVEVEVHYRQWQRKTRTNNFGMLSPHFPLADYLADLPVDTSSHLPVGVAIGTRKGEPYYHPFEYWRLTSASSPNVNQISKAFCVQQAILFKFENQPHLVNSVPEPLFYALLQAGYQRSTLEALETAYGEYKQYLRNLALRSSHPHASDPNGSPSTVT